MKVRKGYALGAFVLAALGSGVAFASSDDGSPGTPFAMAGKFEGYGMSYATTGASQVRGDRGGAGGSDCSAVNTASSQAKLDVPAGATMVKAFLYWVGLERNDDRGYRTIQRLNPTARLRLPDGSMKTVSQSRRMVASGQFNGGSIQYAAHVADVTAALGYATGGTYEVEILGGIPGLCGLSGENARAWQLVVVYDTPAPDYSMVYVYDGLEYLQHSTKSIQISGYDARSDIPSTLTAFVAQGDSNLSGEYAGTSDASFPDFPTNFANETVNGSSTTANGHAVDIATLSGRLTAGTRSMTVNFGTNQDVIVPTTFVLKVASLPSVPPVTTTTAATTTTAVATTTTTTTVARTTTTTAVAPTTTTTVAPTTTTTAPLAVGPTAPTSIFKLDEPPT